MSNTQGSPSGIPQGIGMKQYPASPVVSDGLIAGLSIAYFIVLFLPWTKSAFSISNGSSSFSFSIPFSMNGWGGTGVAAGVFAFLLFIWAGIRLARIAMPMPNHYRSLVSAVLGGLVFLFGLLRIITNLSLLTSHMSVLFIYGLFPWLGLLLAIGVLYAAWGEWREWQFTQISKAPGSFTAAAPSGMFQDAPQPGYPQQGYPQQGYPPQPQDVPQPGYPQPNYPTQPQDVPQPGYPPPPQPSSSPTLQEVNLQGMSQPQAPYQGGVVPPQESEQPSSSGQLQCAHCGSLNLSGTSFCTSCGAPLS